MNKFYIIASALLATLACVSLVSAGGGEFDEGEDNNQRCTLRHFSDEQLLDEVARRGHLRRCRHGIRHSKSRFGGGVGAGVGAGIGVQGSKDKFSAVGGSDRQSTHGSIEGQRGSSHSSKTSGEIEGHNNESDEVQGISKHTDQSISNDGLFNKGKIQQSTDVDGFRKIKTHNQGGQLRGETSRNDNEQSSGRLEFGQESDKRHGAVTRTKSDLKGGAGVGLGVSAGLGGEEEIIEH